MFTLAVLIVLLIAVVSCSPFYLIPTTITITIVSTALILNCIICR